MKRLPVYRFTNEKLSGILVGYLSTNENLTGLHVKKEEKKN
jgi:hypothetical protein